MSETTIIPPASATTTRHRHDEVNDFYSMVSTKSIMVDEKEAIEISFMNGFLGMDTDLLHQITCTKENAEKIAKTILSVSELPRYRLVVLSSFTDGVAGSHQVWFAEDRFPMIVPQKDETVEYSGRKYVVKSIEHFIQDEIHSPEDLPIIRTTVFVDEIFS